MKNIISFISFVSAVTLAGIGCSEDSFLSSGSKTLALVVGLFFAVITVVLVLAESKNDILTSKN
jgi:hypothetical protein